MRFLRGLKSQGRGPCESAGGSRQRGVLVVSRAERVGFEPTVQFDPYTAFPVMQEALQIRLERPLAGASRYEEEISIAN
jgi:hypothetical protein